MSIIAQDIIDFLSDQKKLLSFVDYFIEQFHIEELLNECGMSKRRGVPAIDIFKYLLRIMFENTSIYHDLKQKGKNAPFSYATVIRFLNNANADWMKFTSILSYRIFTFISSYNPYFDGVVHYITDDSSYKRIYSKYVDNFSLQKDHVNGTYYRGFRYGNLSIQFMDIILPINAVLLSSTNPEKIIHVAEKRPRGTPAEIRQELSTMTMFEALYYQLDVAFGAGFKPAEVIFDTWYTYPKTIWNLAKRNMGTIGALKNATTKYEYENEVTFENNQQEKLRLSELFEKVKEQNPTPKLDGIIGFCNVTAHYMDNSFPVRIIFAENVHQSRDYFSILCTDLEADPQKIVSIYRLRWLIEQEFKDLKNNTLRLDSGNQSLNLDGIWAYVSIVLCRYMLLITERELDKKRDRTVQDQFHVCREEDLTVNAVNVILENEKQMIPTYARLYKVSEQEALKNTAIALQNSATFQSLCEKLPNCNFLDEEFKLFDPESDEDKN